jgi:predicted phage terminase large subunit-like protein
VIRQRLNEKDVSGVILGMGLPYVHLCIPMRFDPKRRCTTEIGWTDPRTAEGELMFPERFDESQVSALEKTLGSYGAAGQLQQAPAPRGGGIIKTPWYKFFTVTPRLEWAHVYVDTAQKTGEENDFSVLELWGRTIDGQAVLLDLVRGKWEAPELLTHARSFWIKHRDGKHKPRAMKVEDKVSGTGLIQTLRREGIPIIAIQRNKDKISRGHDAAPFIESGNVLLPMDAPWLSEFLSESEAFPAGAHDDQLDPMFDAIDDVQRLPAQKPAAVTVLPMRHHWN